MGERHALLSPSAAHRWLHCTAAPRLEAEVEDRGSAYAAEGTRAHAAAASVLLAYTAGGDYAAADAALEDVCDDTEMAEAVREYAGYCIELIEGCRQRSKDARVGIEAHVELDDYVPEAWGTVDMFVVDDDRLHVVDFKYGRGVRVEARDNAQLKIYAVGLYARLSWEYSFREVVLHIVQPRLSNTTSWALGREELVEWARTELLPRAAEAFAGRGRQAAGDWCRFCKVFARCRAVAEAAAAATAEASACGASRHQSAQDPRLLTAEEMAAALPLAALCRQWATAVEGAALQMALRGEAVPGYKVVRGRSVRRITDADTLMARLVTRTGLRPDDIYRPRELRTIGELEKAVGRKTFAECSEGCVERPEGKPTLVPADDGRPEIATGLDAVDLSGE